MFTILNKPQETVNADDLEHLQNDLERRLVDVVTQKWDLERELLVLNSASPDPNNLNSTSATTLTTTTATSTTTNSNSTTTNSHSTGGKLKNSHLQSTIDNSDNSCDGFKDSPPRASGKNGDIGRPTSASNDTEESRSSEDDTNIDSVATVSTQDGGQASSVCSSSASITNNNATTTITTTTTATASNKRSHRSGGDRPSKRFRQNSSNSVSSMAGGSSQTFPKRIVQSKHRSKIVPSKFRNSSDESRPNNNKKRYPRNDAPDKLWPFVEQFCAAPTEEQMQELEDMIEAMSGDPELFKIPPSNTHHVKSSKESPCKSTNEHSSTSNGVTPKKTTGKSSTGSKGAKTDEASNSSSLGALTQRLVSSLIEDLDEETQAADVSSPTGKKGKSRANTNNSNNSKSIDMNNAKSLEKRIRQELEVHDILDQQDEIPYASEEDESLRELMVSQYELYRVRRENIDSMKRLLKLAKKHLELEREREKLKEANGEVIAAYHRLIQARQRKRNPSKKDKDSAIKALKAHDAIFRKCDELYLSSLERPLPG